MQEKARDQKPEARITPSLIMDYAKVQRERDEAAAELARLRAERDQLLSALVECRDILCSLNTSDGAVKLAYMSAGQIPAAIKRGYLALQKAGHPNAQEGGEI
jgi:hypothetical protein